MTPAKGSRGDTTVEVKAKANDQDATREAIIELVCGDSRTEIKVSQLSDALPMGWRLSSLSLPIIFRGRTLGMCVPVFLFSRVKAPF